MCWVIFTDSKQLFVSILWTHEDMCTGWLFWKTIQKEYNRTVFCLSLKVNKMYCPMRVNFFTIKCYLNTNGLLANRKSKVICLWKTVMRIFSNGCQFCACILNFWMMIAKGLYDSLKVFGSWVLSSGDLRFCVRWQRMNSD